MATTFDSLKVHDLDVSGKFVLNGVALGDEMDVGPKALPAVFDDSEATTVKALVEDFNSLLGVLRGASIIA